MSVRRNGGMADAYGSGPYGSNTVRVQVPFPAFEFYIGSLEKKAHEA